ncbi:MAG: transketolase [Methylacidiphilales bacterium]|nr:transketolase [Candidatus Methylacidiphilales bacterium]
MRNRIVDLIQMEAEKDDRVVFITGDLGYSVVENIQAAIGERFINAGVAEANMMTMAAGMAMTGLRVYVYSITPFVTMRCYEQIRNDVCYQGGNVRIVGVGAGYSYGTLGPSHHALEDAAILGALPDITVLCPAGCAELDALFAAYADVDAPIYFRIGRERGPDLTPPALTREMPAWIVRDGTSATALCSGAVVEMALTAAQMLADDGLSLRVVSVPVMHPHPAGAVLPLLCDGPVMTVCEAYVDNPLETGTMRMLLDAGHGRPFRSVSVAKRFPKIVGRHETLRKAEGLSVEAIIRAAREICGLIQ